jgi:hypothetical protein
MILFLVPEALKWLVPFYTNLHTLYNNPEEQPSPLGVDDILKLTNLRTLSTQLAQRLKCNVAVYVLCTLQRDT